MLVELPLEQSAYTCHDEIQQPDLKQKFHLKKYTTFLTMYIRLKWNTTWTILKFFWDIIRYFVLSSCYFRQQLRPEQKPPSSFDCFEFFMDIYSDIFYVVVVQCVFPPYSVVSSRCGIPEETI